MATYKISGQVDSRVPLFILKVRYSTASENVDSHNDGKNVLLCFWVLSLISTSFSAFMLT